MGVYYLTLVLSRRKKTVPDFKWLCPTAASLEEGVTSGTGERRLIQLP